MTLDLSDIEIGAFATLLRHTIDDDRYPLSPRVQLLKGILGKSGPSRNERRYRRQRCTRRRASARNGGAGETERALHPACRRPPHWRYTAMRRSVSLICCIRSSTVMASLSIDGLSNRVTA